MSEMEYGTDEHLDGLSRDALKSEVRWWYGRALEMESENDKLREERDMYRDLVGMMDHPDLNVQLQAENAKLRELVRVMHGELVACEENGYVCGGHKFDERVRKLGVEV